MTGMREFDNCEGFHAGHICRIVAWHSDLRQVIRIPRGLLAPPVLNVSWRAIVEGFDGDTDVCDVTRGTSSCAWDVVWIQHEHCLGKVDSPNEEK
jgi:hypothetical protein